MRKGREDQKRQEEERSDRGCGEIINDEERTVAQTEDDGRKGDQTR